MSRVAELLQLTQQDVERRRQTGLVSVPADDRRLRWDRNGFRIIAEIKRSSLSAGTIRRELDPASLAKSYEAAGAAAISVLTEPHFFGGSLADLTGARAAVSLPLLQKDFLIDPFQIAEAKTAGAAFVLLIVRFLSKQKLREMLRTCRELRVNALVEITDEEDLEKLEDPIEYLGVNSRDLQTLQVNTSKFETLRKRLPEAFLIAESGIHSRETLDRIIGLGYHGALIGEHFLRAGDPGSELASFVQRSRPPVRVKICGITNEPDALRAVEAGANALGFIFAHSPRRIDPAVLAAIRPKVPSGVLCAGVFLGQDKPEIEAAMRRFDLHLAQIYDDVHPDLPVWAARRIHAAPAESDRLPGRAVLWDVRADESQLPAVWEALARQPVFALAGGLHPDNVARAIESCGPIWVDVARGVEKEPGVKDPARLKDFLKAVR